MRLLFCVFLLINITSSSVAQDESSLDPLKNQLSNITSDIDKVDTLILMYNHYYSINSDSALYYAQLAYDLAEKINYKKGQIISMTNIGLVHFYNGSLGNALKSYLESNELVGEYVDAKSEDEFAQYQLSKNLNNIGLIYLNQGKLEDAESYLLRSLAIDKNLGNKIAIANCYNNL